MKFRLISIFILLMLMFQLDAMSQIGTGNSTLTRNMPNTNYSRDKEPDILDNPPHGGQVKKSGKYYLEVVVDWVAKTDKLIVYVLNSTGKMVSLKKLSCFAQIIDKKGDIEQIDLVEKDGRFVGQIVKDEINCVITVKKKSKTYSVPFQSKLKY